MSYKVFDFECPWCGAIQKDVMIDESKDSPPICECCEQAPKMVKKVGTAWERHASWGKWRV